MASVMQMTQGWKNYILCVCIYIFEYTGKQHEVSVGAHVLTKTCRFQSFQGALDTP